MPQIITTTNYKAMYNITATTQDAQITALIPAVEDEIIRYLGYNPAIATYTEYYNGTGNNFLRLKNKPINSITSITFDPYATSPTVYSGTNYFYDENSLIYAKPGVTAPATFTEGTQNIKVIYNAGYAIADIPQSLKRAAAVMIHRTILLSDTNRTLTAETLGDYSATYGSAWFDLSKSDWDEARRLLDTGFKPVRFIF